MKNTPSGKAHHQPALDQCMLKNAYHATANPEPAIAIKLKVAKELIYLDRLL